MALQKIIEQQQLKLDSIYQLVTDHIEQHSISEEDILCQINADTSRSMLSDLLLLRLIDGQLIERSQVRQVSIELASLCCTYPHLKTRCIHYLQDKQAPDDFVKELLGMSCMKAELQRLKSLESSQAIASMKDQRERGIDPLQTASSAQEQIDQLKRQLADKDAIIEDQKKRLEVLSSGLALFKKKYMAQAIS